MVRGGGNLGSASPAGDAHPPLLASGAEVELASIRGIRRVPVAEFFTGPKRSVRQPDELIAACPKQTRNMRNPLTLQVNITDSGNAHGISLIPDLVLGLKFPNGSQRCFMAGIPHDFIGEGALWLNRFHAAREQIRTRFVLTPPPILA